MLEAPTTDSPEATELVVDGHTGALPSTVVGLIAEARDNQRHKRLAFAREVELAAHLADLSWLDDEATALPGAERGIHLGHDGTPAVAEFICLEYAAALRVSVESAERLMADALDLRHRLPRLWALVMAGDVEVFRARQFVAATADLDLGACLEIDRQYSPKATSMAWSRLLELVRAAVLAALPDEVAEAKQRAALERRGVWFDDSDLGVRGLHGSLGTADAIHLDATLNWVAEILGRGGNTNSHDARRAQALGVLATPARALQLLQASLLDQLPDDLDDECPRQGAAGHTCGSITVDPERLLPRAQLVVHISDCDLEAGAGVVQLDGLGPGRLDQLGPMLADCAAELLGHSRVSVQPVIDLNHGAGVDRYRPSERMRRGVQLRNPFEAFPWSKRRSDRCDLDHTDPYVWSQRVVDREVDPPEAQAQTRPDNLAPLGRRVHRAKTHGGWQCYQPMAGVLIWRSPAGFTYLVTPSETFELHIPGHRLAPRKVTWGRPATRRKTRETRERVPIGPPAATNPPEPSAPPEPSPSLPLAG